MAHFKASNKPPSLLAFYRVLSPSAGVRVSPLCLGAMNFGDAWKGFMGECNKETSFDILDTFFNAGGNFIDTANNYQGEESELWLGEWMKSRGNRDELVLATKFSTPWPAPDRGVKIKANYAGNHSKSLKTSVEYSLKKLQTDYIDLLYLHWWDFTTSIPELMQSLHHLVVAGKVLHLGISDTPAWVVTKANEYARAHALTPFSVYQGHWSALVRDFERDIIPMCEVEGMALAPWGALGRGLFRTPEEFERLRGERRSMGEQTEASKAVSSALDVIAKRKNSRMTSVALAYVRHKAPYVFPIVGCRNKEQLLSNIEALSIELTDEEVDSIDDATPNFDVGFPMNFLFGYAAGQKYNYRVRSKDIFLIKSAMHLDMTQKTAPPKPHSLDEAGAD